MKGKGKQELCDVLDWGKELVVNNPCRWPDIVMRAIAFGAKLLMSHYVMTKQQVAERMFGVTTKTIDRWRKKNKFPKPGFKTDKGMMFSVTEVLDWKRNNQHVWDV